MWILLPNGDDWFFANEINNQADIISRTNPPIHTRGQFVVDSTLLDYVTWLHETTPSSQDAFSHRVAQELVHAAFRGDCVSIPFNVMLPDLACQAKLLPQLVLPKCLFHDNVHRRIVAISLRKFVRGMHLLFRMLAKKIDEDSTTHPMVTADALRLTHNYTTLSYAFTTLSFRFDEIFCEP